METATAPQPTTVDPLAVSPPIRPVPRAGRPAGLFDLTLVELEERLRAGGHPAYRARQIVGWAYRQLVDDYAAMTTLPTAQPTWQDTQTVTRSG